MSSALPPNRVRGAVAGMAAAAAALGGGELSAGLVRSWASPVEAVAGWIIDVVPGPVERFAIETFGDKDKLVLVVGTLVVSTLLAAVLGAIAMRRPRAWAPGIGAFGVVGVLATLAGPGGAGAAPPSVVAAVVGIVAYPAVVPTGPSRREHPVTVSRREFARNVGLLAAAAGSVAAGGRALAGRFSASTSREAVTLPPASAPLAPLPAGVDLAVDGVTPFLTPAEDFYRVDTALTVPQVPAETWRLQVTGMVDRPLELTYDDLLAMDLVEADITLTCVSNTVGGDLVGNARWTGVRLSDVLDRAGAQSRADQIVGRSVDDWTAGFPVTAAFDRDALIAVGMNGEVLPIERGFPARLIVPGLYGYVSATKWLSGIELTTFDAFDAYWVPRGWDQLAPIKTQARIDTPRALTPIPPGPTPIAGVAWAQTRGIERVEVRVDDGPWQDCDLAQVPGPDTWRQWHLTWDATPGTHRIAVRATDGTGQVQTDERAEPFPNGASGRMTQFVTVADT